MATKASSTTKRELVDNYRYLTNREYNVVLAVSGRQDRMNQLIARLVAAGYNKDAAEQAIGNIFAIDTGIPGIDRVGGARDDK